MGQIQWTIGLVLIGLFAIAIIGFTINFAIDNEAAVDISDDAQMANLFTETSGNISGFDSASESTYTSIINSSIAQEGFTTQSAGQFAITPTNVISVTKNILRAGYVKIFGSGTGFGVFVTTFIGLMVFITGLLIWKTWAGRNPE